MYFTLISCKKCQCVTYLRVIEKCLSDARGKTLLKFRSDLNERDW
jgi:hypothetical protein